MFKDHRYKGPADPTTPCDECGGPTYTFPSGSIWCPNNECHSGTHFVRRVAFERAPGHPLKAQAPKHAGARALKALPKPIAPQPIKPRGDGFDRGLDAFVEGDDK